MSNTAAQTVTLTIMLTNGHNIAFEVGTVEQAILAFRRLKGSLDNVGAYYEIEGMSRMFHI